MEERLSALTRLEEVVANSTDGTKFASQREMLAMAVGIEVARSFVDGSVSSSGDGRVDAFLLLLAFMNAVKLARSKGRDVDGPADAPLFRVIDTDDGSEADPEAIAKAAGKGEFACDLVWCDMDGWYVDAYGNLALLDECGGYDMPRDGRYRIEWSTDAVRSLL